MKKYLALMLAFLLALGTVPAMGEAIAISRKVDRIGIYGQAMLDIVGEDFKKAGFEPGDIVTVSAGSFTGDMPCFSGYYVDRGACMLYVNPFTDSVALCINYGNFSEMAGIGEGDAVTIAMKEKAGAQELEEINSLVYSDDRADFASDAVFANFRPVVAGKLYRSASPVDNVIHRARYVDALIREAGVQTVFNMSNTPEQVEAFIAAEDYDSPYYRELYEAGKVLAMKLIVDFTSDDFAADIVKGFSFLVEGDTPFLVHCMEGKDRTGFAMMLLEALMGWSEAQIVDDYMQTYANYYGIGPGNVRYDMIVEKNIGDMLRIVTGQENGASLADVDLRAAAEHFLLDHGMTGEALGQLEAKLAADGPDEILRGIFDALVAEDSGYSKTKAMYTGYYPDTVYSETLEDDGFTIAVSGNEYMNGSWTFRRDGDYLTATFGSDDISGVSMALNVIQAVGAYYGINTSLITSYVNGLGALGIESENIRMSDDEAAGTTSVSIKISGPWDMKELDDMAFDGAALSQYEPLGREHRSMGGSVGKMMMIANGSADALTLLVGEYGGLDDLAWRSIVNIVKALRPDGWEDFIANYTELADAEAAGYSVRLNVDRATVDEIIDDANADYSFALVRFGSGSAGEGEYESEPVPPADAPTAEAFAEGYFSVIAGLEAGTAGASLKTAIAASDVCAFAVAHDLYNPDDAPVRANMLAAFTAMDEAGQAQFWQNFDTVRALLDDCLDDYDANRAVFDDAGVADAMDAVMYDPLNRLAWMNLRDYTLTLGNDVNAE